MITTFIADDQAMVRQGFGALLAAQTDIRVVGDAANGRDAMAGVLTSAPDVVLMDVRMPEMNGLDAAREILAQTASKVIMLTTFDVDDYVYAALRAGASGFLLKDAPADELIRAVRVVAAGDALLAPSVTRRMIADLMGRHAVPRRCADELARLTPRETEVLVLLARGMSNAEIAGELVVSDETVKTHVGRIFSKLGLRDRAQAVVIAYESGLVSPFARSAADEPRTGDAGRIGVHAHARSGIDHADRSSHRWR